MALIDIQVPDIGDFAEVTVIELLVKPGDTVKPEQSLLTVESDKASMEIPSSHGGVVKELRIKLGDKVKEGSVVLVLEAQAAATSAAAPAAIPAPASAPAPAPAAAAVSVPVAAVAAAVSSAQAMPAHVPGAPTDKLPHASPSVRKFARELGVPLAEVKGSGLKGRITPDDVQGFTRAVMAGDVRTQAQSAKSPAGSAGSDGAALGFVGRGR
jgi:pyruvate dehydrogenase E2 component (dihydrolipoamide acetyltransferase)